MLYVGMRWDGMDEWVGMVIIGHRSSKSTFGSNSLFYWEKRLQIWWVPRASPLTRMERCHSGFWHSLQTSCCHDRTHHHGVCCLVHFLQTSHGTRDRIWREKRQVKQQTGITTSLAIIIVIKRKHIWVISRDGEVLKGAYIDKLDPPSINQQLLAREFRLPHVHTLVCPVDHIRWTEWNEQGSEIKLWMKGDWEKDEGFRALC